MKYIFTGFKEHGKDTACEIVEEYYGLTSISSSWFACKKFIFERLKDVYDYLTIEECFADRVNKRNVWYQLIREYNAEDKTRLGRELFEEYNIYNGIRDKEELDALVELYGDQITVVWIDAIKRKPPEDTDSMNITMDDCDLVIDNNGDLKDLMINIRRIMAVINIRTLTKEKSKIENVYQRNLSMLNRSFMDASGNYPSLLYNGTLSHTVECFKDGSAGRVIINRTLKPDTKVGDIVSDEDRIPFFALEFIDPKSIKILIDVLQYLHNTMRFNLAKNNSINHGNKDYDGDN